jgi:hypothetical protein
VFVVVVGLVPAVLAMVTERVRGGPAVPVGLMDAADTLWRQVQTK